MCGEDDLVVPVAASVDALREVFATSGYAGLELEQLMPMEGPGDRRARP